MKQCKQPDGLSKKIAAKALGATATIFCQRTHKHPKNSTLLRMNYLHQPIAGLITKTSQLFSGRVILSRPEIG
jgi:hypothetical protein